MFTATLERPSPRYYTKRHETPPAASNAADVGLAQGIRAGDDSAFRELVERHQYRIHRIVVRTLHSTADAEEIAQDVFVKVFFSIRTFDHRCSLFTWIYRIAVNEAYSHLRRLRVERFQEGASYGDTLAADLRSLADGCPTPDRILAQRDSLNWLLALIPENDRVLLLWKEVEGYSVTQLAEVTGLKESTVKMRLFRARRKLVDLTAASSRSAGNSPEFRRLRLQENV